MSNDAKPELVHRRIYAVSFAQSVAFAGESLSVRIASDNGARGISNIVDSITPARLGPDGCPVAIDKDQHATGVQLRKAQLVSGRKAVKQAFVPFANIKEIVYGE